MPNTSIAFKEISLGQKEECATIVANSARKVALLAVEDLRLSCFIGSEDFQKRVIEKADVLAEHVASIVRDAVKNKLAEMAENTVGCLKNISGDKQIVIGETDGIETLANASDLFTGFLDSDFEAYGTNVPGKPTKPTPVEVFEQVKDGDFKTIYDGLRNLDDLCFEQAQIKAFPRDHSAWLHPKGWATFFLFKVGEGKNKKFFVARVYQNSGKLEALVSLFSDDRVWLASRRSRFVFPQQTLVA